MCVQVFALHSSTFSSYNLCNYSLCVCVDFVSFGPAYLSNYTHQVFSISSGCVPRTKAIAEYK